MKQKINYIPFVVFILVATLSLGFSVFSKNLLIKDLAAQVRIVKDIRITGIIPNGSTNSGLADSEDYNVNNITPSFYLPNENSTVTYTVEVTNIGNTVMGISSITGLPSNLVYSITDYTMGDPICDVNDKCSLGAIKTFDITFGYSDGGYDSSNINFNLQLDFTFGRFYNVTYINGFNSNYPNVVLENTSLIVSPISGGISIMNSDTSELVTDYTLNDGVLTIPDVDFNVTIKFMTLSEYINYLYDTGEKSSVYNGDYTYNRVKSRYLINDRLGGRATDLNGGNVRYYGNSAANYIYFNCDDYNNQSASTCETWRIIGVFDGKVKITRNVSIGSYAWATTNNKWESAAITKLLNPGFESETVGGSLYWLGRAGTCYTGASSTTSCDFTNTGLKNDVTRNFITNEKLYLTAPKNTQISVSEMFYQDMVMEAYIVEMRQNGKEKFL